MLGFHPYYCKVFRLWDNMDGLVTWLARPSPITLQASLFALYGVFWIIGLLPMSVRPPELVRAAWMVPFHVGGAALIALIGESRIFVGLAPVLIPLGLWNLLPEVRGVELDDEAPQDAGGRSGIGGAPHAHEEGVNSPNDTTRGQH